MASNRLSAFKIKLQGDLSWDSIIENVLQMDSEDLHCVISEQSKDYIGGYYLISVVQNQKIYNFEDSKFETISIKKQNIVKFDIFILSGKMLLWGNKRSSDKIIVWCHGAIDGVDTICQLVHIHFCPFYFFKFSHTLLLIPLPTYSSSSKTSPGSGGPAAR